MTGTEVNPQVLTDEQLMAKFKSTQSAEYFEAIFHRHKKRITDYLANDHTRGDRHWAEDLTQEVFLKAFERHTQVRGSIVGWLVMIATNLAVNDRKRRGRLKRGGPGGEISLSQLAGPITAVSEEDGRWFDSSEYLHPVDDTDSPDSVVIRGDEWERLREMILTLPPLKRELLEAVYFRGVTLEQYAAENGIQYGTVCSRLHRSLVELRSRLVEPDEPLAQTA